ncbi:hypothetical protein IAT38_007562 [Cryptococcus sp. DSM 104549]
MFSRSIALLTVLSTLLLIPFTLATAASQFHIEPTRHASACFVDCHNRVVNTVNIPGTNGGNGFQWIAVNCRFDGWMDLMSQCLPLVCTSAPDVAYAVEYGTSFCERAGVKDVVIPLPADYLASANGTYFQSAEYLASGAEGMTVGKAVLGASVLGALALVL